MKSKNPSPLAVLLSAALLLSSAPELWAAARDGAGKGPASGVPVVLPRLPETVTVPGVPALSTPDLAAGATPGRLPSAPLPAPAAPAVPQGPRTPAAPQTPLEKAAAAVAPDLEAAAAPRTSAPEASAAGRRIEAVVTGQAGLPVAVDLSDVGAPPADVFKSLTRAQKKVFNGRYLAYLLERDGIPDPVARRFTIRESTFRALALTAMPARGAGSAAVDQNTFTRNEGLHKPEKDLDERTLWALAVGKSNRTEADGVSYGTARVNLAARGPNHPMTFIEVEEFYHTRILKEVLTAIGIDMRMLKPHPVTRLMIRAMVHTPKPLANILILCGEVVGVTLFRLLAEKARELYKDQPQTAAYIADLFRQIVVDEVGHVQYVRSQLGPVRLWLARKIMPLFTRYFLSDIPELARLFGKERLMKEILNADIEGATAPFPERFAPFPAPAE